MFRNFERKRTERKESVIRAYRAYPRHLFISASTRHRTNSEPRQHPIEIRDDPEPGIDPPRESRRERSRRNLERSTLSRASRFDPEFHSRNFQRSNQPRRRAGPRKLRESVGYAGRHAVSRTANFARQSPWRDRASFR